MKKIILSGALAVLTLGAQGALYTETFTSGTAIPDGNPVGISFSGTVSDVTAGATVSGLTVGFNITGGYNGDLYAYLVAPNGTMVVLLNQPGSVPFYAPGMGFGDGTLNSFVLDASSPGIQTASETAGVALTGTYGVAGTLTSFNGSVADGSWTLFFADLSSGGGTSTLNSWSLNLTTVPEPVNLALAVFAGLLGLAGLARRYTYKAINHKS